MSASADYTVTSVPVLNFVACVCCPLQQCCRCTERSLCLPPLPPCRHLLGLSFHVWLLFSLSTKLTTRNVKLCKVRRPQGKSWCQPATCLCGICLQRGVKPVKNWGAKKKRKWVNQSRRVHGDMCVCLSVCHCVCVSVSVYMCACLRRTACPGTGGLSEWIHQKPGAVLCTIRIKVAISGCYLLRDVLCSQFWWPLRPSPLNSGRDGLCCCWVTRMGPIFNKLAGNFSSDIYMFTSSRIFSFI